MVAYGYRWQVYLLVGLRLFVLIVVGYVLCGVNSVVHYYLIFICVCLIGLSSWRLCGFVGWFPLIACILCLLV